MEFPGVEMWLISTCMVLLSSAADAFFRSLIVHYSICLEAVVYLDLKMIQESFLCHLC